MSMSVCLSVTQHLGPRSRGPRQLRRQRSIEMSMSVCLSVTQYLGPRSRVPRQLRRQRSIVMSVSVCLSVTPRAANPRQLPQQLSATSSSDTVTTPPTAQHHQHHGLASSFRDTSIAQRRKAYTSGVARNLPGGVRMCVVFLTQCAD